MAAPYRWTIIRDEIADPKAEEGTHDNAVGLVGPRDACETVNKNGVRFEMYDDDNNLYYVGYLYGDYDGFEPLEDFGTPNAGCTGIKINGRWV